MLHSVNELQVKMDTIPGILTKNMTVKSLLNTVDAFLTVTEIANDSPIFWDHQVTAYLINLPLIEINKFCMATEILFLGRPLVKAKCIQLQI